MPFVLDFVERRTAFVCLWNTRASFSAPICMIRRPSTSDSARQQSDLVPNEQTSTFVSLTNQFWMSDKWRPFATCTGEKTRSWRRYRAQWQYMHTSQLYSFLSLSMYTLNDWIRPSNKRKHRDSKEDQQNRTWILTCVDFTFNSFQRLTLVKHFLSLENLLSMHDADIRHQFERIHTHTHTQAHRGGRKSERERKTISALYSIVRSLSLSLSA